MKNNYYLEIISPLDQFEIKDLIYINTPIFKNLHFSLTNIGLYLVIGVLLVFIINLYSVNYNKIIPNN